MQVWHRQKKKQTDTHRDTATFNSSSQEAGGVKRLSKPDLGVHLLETVPLSLSESLALKWVLAQGDGHKEERNVCSLSSV